MSLLKINFILLLLITPLLLITSVYGQESQIIKLIPTDDSFVVTDIADPLDIQSLSESHFGDENYLKIWYAFNVTKTPHQILTMGFLRFDLSDLNTENISSAKLMMKPFIANIKEDKPVYVYFIKNNTWNESNLTFNNRPQDAEMLAATKVSDINKWYSWNVTSAVKTQAGNVISLGLLLKDIQQFNEELIVFHSKEADDKQNAPYLEITYTAGEVISVKPQILQDEISQDTTFNAIIGGLIAAAIGVGVLFYLIKQKSQRDISRKEIIPSEKLSSIHVKPTPIFVDPNNPSYYIKRYLREPKYKSWFDMTCPNYTIYEAVGISESEFLRLKKEFES